MKDFFDKCSNITLVITDVDGVLTDGTVYFSSRGEEMKKFNMRDGMGVELLHKNKIKVILLTKENSKIVKKRGEKISADKIILGIQNKKNELEKIQNEFKIDKKNIAYIGDDLNDLEIMSSVGFSATPSDGHPKIKDIADYICDSSGGNGAFREFSELILDSKKE
tara:strand:- start:279 stop:773 length:495 start_codon:yes stop_codon:yes gene_type:complete